ncbi:MAG: family 78 glycoside hydrolase catalytic domain [Opitutae bacterium]|nr:family 78 glycoside hydrolase catalytic domain [Opitutae bacterium]
MSACSWLRPKSSVELARLRCEGLERSALVDTAEPRFSWQLRSAERGVRQTAYQVRVVVALPDGQPGAVVADTGRVASDQSQWVTVSGFKATPRTAYQWQVRVWDQRERPTEWSGVARFETGLLGGEWPAQWVGDGYQVAKHEAPRARYFRKVFTLPQAPVRARLLVSALGLVEPWLNGRQVARDCFVPGWPDYRKRAFYVAYDVTRELRAGVNVCGLILGDGWYSGTMLRQTQIGTQPLVSAALEITDTAGQTSVVATDGTWQWAEGPIRSNSIYHGETFDARLDQPGWCRVEGCSWTWQPAQVAPKPAIELTARISPPVRRIEGLRPVERREVRPGVFIYDLGQNMVGWVRLKAQAPAGQEIQLRFAEMLEADGSLHTANLRSARATARYIAKGEGMEYWEPRFTFFGFRYVEVTGLAAPADDAVIGVVLHSDLTRIGRFECSNPLLNKLYANTLWGQKGNFLELPTDCPQRNERLGWTGDAQVFCNTANYNLAAGTFYRQWLAAVRDGFKPGTNGGFGDVAPQTDLNHGSAGWSDAGAIVPWVTWLHTADQRLLEENFPAIQQWVELQATEAPEGIRRSRKSYGDWLAPGYKPSQAPTPYVLIATAYFARSTDIAAQIAERLGRAEVAAKNRALLAKIKTAFRKEFIADDGRIACDEQTAYLLALGFDLVPAELRPKMIEHLVRVIGAKNNHLATGFIGTPLLTPVLTQIGRPDLAYAVVLQETYPGWLFSVKNGATTIWERWDSWTPEGGFNKDGMNSFNHYAYGSVVEWFYDGIAGLRPEPSAPGWKRFTIAPQLGGGLTFARAQLETPYGRTVSGWRIESGQLTLEITIPDNTQATVSLPTTDPATVQEGGRPLAQLSGMRNLTPKAGRLELTLPSGDYVFTLPAPK